MIIDCHGHYTTAPKALDDWRNRQVAGIQDPALRPRVADLKISDDELRESIETNQLITSSRPRCCRKVRAWTRPPASPNW